MTNDEMNAVAQRIADTIKLELENGLTAEDIQGLVFVSVKTAIAEAYAAGQKTP